MRKTSLTIVAVCATLLWAGAVHARFKPPPLTCAQRQVRDVDALTGWLTVGQALCTADLTRHDCETNVCSPQAFPATGQTTPYALGVDDGEIQAGAALNYTDNGDGTITDNNTKLMWEKKSDDGGIHDEDNSYRWSGLCQDNSTRCGTSADCSGLSGTALCTATDGQGTGLTIFQWVAQLNAEKFAGHTDWRIPNLKELESIVDSQNYDPAVDAEFFNTVSCSSGCTLDGAGGTTECSCTKSGFYWSATTYIGLPSYAWNVFFDDGSVSGGSKPNLNYVRAVRSGL
jgi:Protein of unknown function (DUF1566)